MESRAKLLGHPIHPMLIPFPLGLLPTALVFDIIALSTDNARWADVSFWMITAGIIGALLAAVFGRSRAPRGRFGSESCTEPATSSWSGCSP
jgi:uncharacterized membrane protein